MLCVLCCWVSSDSWQTYSWVVSTVSCPQQPCSAPVDSFPWLLLWRQSISSHIWSRSCLSTLSRRWTGRGHSYLSLMEWFPKERVFLLSKCDVGEWEGKKYWTKDPQNIPWNFPPFSILLSSPFHHSSLLMWSPSSLVSANFIHSSCSN